MPPAIIAAGIGLAGTAVAASAQSKAADKAASASQYAADQSAELQRQALAASTAANAPYAAAGNTALDALLGRFNLGGGSGAAAAGGPDWNAYIAQNGDVQAVQDVIDGKAQGTQDQLNFINDFRRSGKSSLGEYHASVVPGRAIPTVAAAPAAAAGPAAPANPTQTYAPSYVSKVPAYVAPPRPTQAALDVSLDKYTPSPDYQYQQTEGSNLLNAKFGAQGLLQSGAAMKALQKFGQDLALGDYSQWRDYTTGQYNNDRNVLNTNYENDRGFGYTKNLNDQNFDYNKYVNDRAYTTGREDNYTANLFKLTGIGQNSANNTAAGSQTYAANTGNILSGNARAIGDAAESKGDAYASAINSGVGTAQNFLKSYGTSYGGQQAVTNPVFNPSVLAPSYQAPNGLSNKLPSLNIWSR